MTYISLSLSLLDNAAEAAGHIRGHGRPTNSRATHGPTSPLFEVPISNKYECGERHVWKDNVFMREKDTRFTDALRDVRVSLARGRWCYSHANFADSTCTRVSFLLKPK